MRHIKLSILWLLVAAMAVSGCGSGAIMSKEAQKAAKNWFAVIRGAQVFPINPLRADLKPGDLYLVNKTIEEQSNTMDEKGYLPLDHKIDKLCYTTDSEIQSTNNDESSLSCITPSKRTDARIPSFEFTVDRRAGFQLNVPVDGIPVGLGMVNSNNVVVSVNISQVTVKSVHTIDLHRSLKKWAQKDRNQKYLIEQAAVSKGPLMLRAVSEVYYTKEVDISIKGLDKGGAKAAVGGGALDQTNPEVAETLSLENIKTKEEADNLVGIVQELSKIQALKTLPGGTIQYAKSSENSIYMKNEFPVPVAIGYVAIDVLINRDGTIGSPLIFFNSKDDLYVEDLTSKDMWEFSLLVGACEDLEENQQQSIAMQMADYIESSRINTKSNLKTLWSSLTDYVSSVDRAEYEAIIQKMRKTYLMEVKNARDNN